MIYKNLQKEYFIILDYYAEDEATKSDCLWELLETAIEKYYYFKAKNDTQLLEKKNIKKLVKEIENEMNK